MISRIKTFALYSFEFFAPPIIQFSPPRTGSTLVWNLLRELFPEKEVRKQHRINRFHSSRFSRSPIVCTIRHPLDAVASSIQRYELAPTPATIKSELQRFDRNGIWDVLKIRTNPRALILKYEEFVDDFDFLFNKLETFFKILVDMESRLVFQNSYNIDKVRAKAEKMVSFENWDKADHIHGRHISNYMGRPGYYKEFFDQDQINLMMDHFQDFMNVFGYGSAGDYGTPDAEAEDRSGTVTRL